MRDNNTGRRLEKQSAYSGSQAQRKPQKDDEDRGRRIRRRILTAATVISAVIVLIWAVFTFFIRTPDLPGLSDIPGISASGSSAAHDWDVEGPDISKRGRKEGVYTFLVAGLDVASGATDTMLLLSYDINEKTIQGLNLPRDTIMNVSYNSKRLNTIYTINKGKDKKTQVEKGMTALKEHVSKLTGILPDYYVLLEWEAIGELVDALGGVEFEVPFDMDYDDPYQNLHIHQKKGLRLLSGDDAMQVIRHRKNNDGSHSAGDVGRLSIQQDFLKAVVKKCLQPSTFLKVPALAEIFAKNVKTDLTVGNILAFAKSAYGMDPATGVSFQTAPLGGNAWYKGAAMVTLDGPGILEIVNNGMNPYLEDIELDDLELIYKKSDGSFGVTNGTLADSKMGGKTSKPAATQKPEQTVQPEKPKEEQPATEQTPPETEQPVAPAPKPDASQEQPDQSGQPQTPDQGGEVQQPVEPEQGGQSGEASSSETTQPQEPEPPVEENPTPPQSTTEQVPQETPDQPVQEEIPEHMIPVTP